MTAASPLEPPDRLTAAGADLLEQGRVEEAVEVLRHAVAAGERGADDLLARVYLDGGDWHAAADMLGRLVAAGHVAFAGRLGAALAEIGDTDRAEFALRLAVDHGELAACNDLAILLSREGRLDEAVPVLVRAADAGDLQAAANLVELLYEAGDLRTATEVAERYADDSRPDTLVALADVRAAAGRVDEAESLYRRAVALGAVQGHTAYGTFLASVRGDPVRAEWELRAAVQDGEPGCAFTYGRFMVDEGRPAEAREHLATAAARGDAEAAALLAEVDGADPFDD
jgi:TPR repeat protein